MNKKKLRIVDDEGNEYWTEKQSAHHCKVSIEDFKIYVSRKQAPAAAQKWHGICVWKAQEVKDWYAKRTDLH